MEKIYQKLTTDVDVICRSEFIYIEQRDNENSYLDVVQLEKQSIQALIDALKKYME